MEYYTKVLDVPDSPRAPPTAICIATGRACGPGFVAG